jgi:trehalose-phosphatase
MKVTRPLFDELRRIRYRLDRTDHVLVALDFDGTIAPIARHPAEAATPAETAEVLEDLAASARYSLAIISGRSVADLRGKAPAGAILVGNHGLEMEGGGISWRHEGAERMRQAIDHVCCDLETALAAVRGVQVERKGFSATVHYRNAPPQLAEWIRMTAHCATRPHMPGLFLAPALEAVEVRPRLHWNKGSAVRFLLGAMKVPNPGLVCAGDDVTDEDMFGILRWEVSIKVGRARRTRAAFHVGSTAELLRFLQLLAAARVSKRQLCSAL